jgi:hypothetical protein
MAGRETGVGPGHPENSRLPVFKKGDSGMLVSEWVDFKNWVFRKAISGTCFSDCSFKKGDLRYLIPACIPFSRSIDHCHQRMAAQRAKIPEMGTLSCAG